MLKYAEKNQTEMLAEKIKKNSWKSAEKQKN